MVGFLEFVDDALGTNFNAPVYDPKKGRAKMVKVIDKALEQHSSGKTPPVRSWKTGNNGATSFSPKLDGKPVLIGGKATNFIPSERFADALTVLKRDVQAGALDKEIKAALEGDKASSGSSRATRGPSTGLGNKAQPDNAEWMAKFVGKYGPAPGEGYVPNSKGTKWVSAANAARGKKAKGVS